VLGVLPRCVGVLLHCVGLLQVITRPQWKPPPGTGAFFVSGTEAAKNLTENVRHTRT
jgi:hypothetical protein